MSRYLLATAKLAGLKGAEHVASGALKVEASVVEAWEASRRPRTNGISIRQALGIAALIMLLVSGVRWVNRLIILARTPDPIREHVPAFSIEERDGMITTDTNSTFTGYGSVFCVKPDAGIGSCAFDASTGGSTCTCR